MALVSGSTTRINLMEGIIKMITLISFETVFKREEIYECSTASAINVDGITPTTQGFMLSGIIGRAFL